MCRCWIRSGNTFPGYFAVPRTLLDADVGPALVDRGNRGGSLPMKGSNTALADVARTARRGRPCGNDGKFSIHGLFSWSMRQTSSSSYPDASRNFGLAMR